MKIGVLGSGDVGQVLAKGLAELGHEIKIGSRDPQSDKIKAWLEKTRSLKTSAGNFMETAMFGELLVLATSWGGTEQAIQLAGVDHFSNKIVIDVTNPLIFPPNQPPRLAIGHTDSAGEKIQRWLPKSRVVKAFNSVGNPHMVHPQFPDGKPDMFICGDNAPAKKTVTEICHAFGWSVVDLGGIDSSRYLEPLAMIWITYFLLNKSGNHAFKLLRK